MLQSKLFPKTKKEAPKGAESVNHKLLVRAGYIDQLMAGSWTLLPLGWRVVTKINQIIRTALRQAFYNTKYVTNLCNTTNLNLSIMRKISQSKNTTSTITRKTPPETEITRLKILVISP